ncbi:MAG: hypothetical protein A2X61_16420 [Ignavibacteria bacterium GWB2_35_12]|nr:MAG: hypothetical protein A2X61_16420 [Ignavibacteria bacterium GWB2_35_12]OGU94046.1 MAG: hypothetical protein A2220_07620 [Ignavibacteria bacterium RIFOXYA2_FULL_35_10]OGV23590.1 MAG: hypothetical protein A2475_07735 [Ignavibacteria bacterium RIFOXYC2_FULL_35_21]
MLKIKNNNVLIPIAVWDDLKKDQYFNELIEAFEDRLDLLDAQKEATEFFDFREYDNKRLKEINFNFLF